MKYFELYIQQTNLKTLLKQSVLLTKGCKKFVCLCVCVRGGGGGGGEKGVGGGGRICAVLATMFSLR